MKKRIVCVALCAALLMCMAGTAFATTPFTKYKMTFVSTDAYYHICGNTTSKPRLVANNDYARLYVYNTTATKNNVYRASYAGSFVTGKYYKKTTDGTWMYYTEDVPAEKSVTLRGRPDSSVDGYIAITGEFGAG